MKMSGLLSRSHHDVSGIVGTARFPRRGDSLPRRMSVKDIVFVSVQSLTTSQARQIVDADVAFVVNVDGATALTPRAAFRVLAAAGVPVLDGISATTVQRLKDGDRVRIDGDTLFIGDRELGSGSVATASALLDRNAAAERALVDAALTHYADSVEFLQVENSLLLDGEGVPEVGVRLRDRHVLVVTGGAHSEDELAKLKPFIREYRPIVIGVDEGANIAMAARLRPDIVVGDANVIEETVLRAADEIVLPADRDGRCAYIQRITDLQLGAVTFPAMAPARDLAVLLAHHNGAAMIVTTGESDSLADKYAQTGTAPSTSVVNMLVGDKLVGATACASLYRSRGSGLALAFFVLAVLAIVAAALVFQDQTEQVLRWLAETWNSFALWVQGWFTSA